MNINFSQIPINNNALVKANDCRQDLDLQLVDQEFSNLNIDARKFGFKVLFCQFLYKKKSNKYKLLQILINLQNTIANL